MEKISGSVKTITFRNEDNGYSILKINDASNKNKLHTVVGSLPEFHPGELVDFTGQWIEHPKFGKQLKVQSWEIIPPNSLDSITAYLASGIFKGIGVKTSEKIVSFFGKESLDILDDNPKNISKVPGFSSKKVEQFANDWDKNKSSKKVLLFLHEHGIASSTSIKIYKSLGSNAIEIINKNPYVLVDEIKYMGFKKADEIAYKLGLAKDSANRLTAGLRYTLQQSTNDGHVFLPKAELLSKAAKILGINQYTDEIDSLIYSLDDLSNTDEVKVKDDNFYIPWLYLCEKKIADWVKINSESSRKISTKKLRNTLDFFEERAKERIKLGESNDGVLFYSDEQKDYISQAIKQKLFILTGGPGTGKTTTLRGILQLMEELKIKPTLAAPTGRAAKRMSDLCLKPAMTIHRLLEYSPVDAKFKYDEFNSLDVNHLIIDEASMLDTWLMSCLLKALPYNASLILIGDKDQLPSVGPGNVLRELLNSEKVAKGVLTKIYRQAEASDIVTNAHRINRGLLPKLNLKNDFININYSNHEDALDKIKHLCCHEIPNTFKDINPIEDIQVLCPMKQGTLGNYNMNLELQKVLNPETITININGINFKRGDRVMQIQNNYEWNVFNGDIGFIHYIDKEAKTVSVNFDTGMVKASFVEMDSIVPAYSMTIHKSQGSEYPVIIIILDPSHHVMLQRNLLYTAITRARNKVFLVANEESIQKSVNNNRIIKRNTRLAQLISDTSKVSPVDEIEPTHKSNDTDKSEFMSYLED